MTPQPFVVQAKQALKEGRRADAKHMLLQAVQLDPQNHKLWLALSRLAETSEEALAFIIKGQKHLPQNPQLAEVKKRLEQKIKYEQVQFMGVKRPYLITSFAFVALLLLAGTAFGWTQSQRHSRQLPDRIPLMSQVEPISITSSQPVSLEATSTAVTLNGKQIANQDVPRATWTITPTPSPTPTNTPTVLPTFVSSNSYTQAARPFGIAADERWIDVNLTTQVLKAYEGDTLVFSTVISSGTWEHRTVTGQFKIWLRFESQTMDGRRLGYDYYLENVPHVMYFFEDYAIHGTYWHNNFGTPMSHGCVNVNTTDAKWLYNWASLGTWVNVHY